MIKLSYTKLIVNTAITKIRIAALRHLLSKRFNSKKVYIISSSPRSGSTWLGDLCLSVMPNACTLFEPLQLNHVPQAKDAGFEWRTFKEPEEIWKEGVQFLNQVFSGQIVNKWTSREIRFKDALNAKSLIVKFVRANRLLPWICNNFDIPPPILLLRHPCAVIASQLQSDDWKNSKRPEIPTYLNSFPAFKRIIQNTTTVEENLACLWALDQLPALLYKNPHPWLIVTYEELFKDSLSTLKKIMNAWEIEADYHSVKAEKPSSVVYSTGISGIDGWRKNLSEKQVANILRTVRAFGINFYNTKLEPDYSILYSINLAQSIQKKGI